MTPSLKRVLLTFLLVGPLTASVFIALLRGSFIEIPAVTFGWYAIAFSSSSLWFFTLLPILVAAVLHWYLFCLLQRTWPRLTAKRFSSTVILGSLGAGVSVIAWITSMAVFSFFFGKNFPSLLGPMVGSVLFVAPIIVPTGILLGVLIGLMSGRPQQ